jgi:hypothetical protein
MSQAGDRQFEIFGPRCARADDFRGARVLEGERMGVKHLARSTVVGLRAQPNILFSSIDAVPDERVTKVLEMNPNLVRSSCVQGYLDQGRKPEPFKDTVACVRLAAMHCPRGHFLTVALVA